MSLAVALIADESATTRRPVPRVLHLLTVLVVALTCAFTSVAVAPTASADNAPLSDFDARMLTLVNNARTAAGLPALKPAAGLVNLSLFWSDQMANGVTNGELKHNPDAFKQTLTYGASNRTSWAENVAKWTPTSTSADQIFNAYWASPGHKANIMGASYRFVGIASVSNAKGVSYNTMTFTDKADNAGTSWAKNRYSNTIYAVNGTSRHGVSYDEWATAGFPSPGGTNTEYVKYPWADAVYAVTFWPGTWEWDKMDFAEWSRAGYPTPRTAGWIEGSTIWKYRNAAEIYITDPDGLQHALTYAEWAATNFMAPTVR
ncbi:CAP domain-containing protein [Nakamurella deserti]|uniref:CAP domain-containing protein n=1 Tax=Nakamurella deserti TaxID=2164074 RepID=UPI000DBE96DB|nr:CAP domain-containing protein [Nakamurella deserti]